MTTVFLFRGVKLFFAMYVITSVACLSYPFLPESKRVQQKNMKYPLECMRFPLIPLWFAASRISRTSGFRCDSTRFLTNAACPFAFASGLSCCSLHPDRDSCRWGCGEGCRRLDKRWQSWSLYRLAPGRDEHHCDYGFVWTFIGKPLNPSKSIAYSSLSWRKLPFGCIQHFQTVTPVYQIWLWTSIDQLLWCPKKGVPDQCFEP